METAFLSGERIYLRPLRRNDAPPFTAWLNDVEVCGTLNWHRPLTLEAEETWLEAKLKEQRDVMLAICLHEGQRLIGATDLRLGQEKNRDAMFGIMIGAKEEWNNGYGTEATRMMVGYGFETLNLNRIGLNVYANNPRGMRAYEKVGFVREGLLRQSAYVGGRYLDLIVMGLLREEWYAQRERTKGTPE